MAITISQQPDSLSLSGNLKDVILTSVAGQVPLQLSVLDTSGSSSSYKPILSHVYFPDNGNRIVINLSRVVQDQLSFSLSSGTSAWQQTLLARSFRLNIDDLSPVYFTVVRAGIDNLQETVSNWLSANFLTWQPTVKHVTYSTPEFLTYYAQQSCRVRVKIYYPDGTTPTTHTLATLTSGAWTIPVSYAVIASLLGLSTPQQLSAAQHLPGAYDVWIETTGGTRLTYVQRYVASSMRENEQWVLFENSLGGVDSFRAYGQGTVQAEHQHQQAEQDNDTAEYRVDTVRIQRRSTGWMDKAQRRWMLDFFPASRRWICQDGVFRPIIMTDDSVSYTLDNMPAEFEFTFRYTSNRPYLNLSRQLTLPSVLNITAPDLQSFTVPPRLVEFPRIGPTEGALIPVQSTYGEHWSVLSLESLIDYINQEIGLNGHIHSNKVDLDRISTDADGYLWLSSSQPGSETTLSKVKAGDSDHWSGHLFSDWLDQPVRHNDNVNFASVMATGDIVSTGGGVAAMGIADLSMSFGVGTYELPIASASTLGGIKIGSGLTIDADGTLHAQGGGNVTSVVGQTGVVTVEHIASALTTAGYKLTDTIYELTKTKVEAVLTGNISSHTHSQYLTGITALMVTTALGYTPFNASNFTKAGIKSTLGISDWALAAQKPSYSYGDGFLTGFGTLATKSSLTSYDIPTLQISKISSLQSELDSKQSYIGSCGSHDQPVYFVNGTAAVIDALTVPGDIVSTGGGVAAMGIADLSMSVGGGTYELPIASASTLGGIKVGSGLAIDSDGTLHAQGGGNVTSVVGQTGVVTVSHIASALTSAGYKLTDTVYELTKSKVTAALGYTPFNSADFTKAGIQSTLGISDWALAAQKPSYSYGDGFLTGFGALATKSSLSSSDIPTLQISKIDGLQSALNSKQSYIGSCGSHDQPVYFVNGTATVIDALNGNAATATKLKSVRSIWGNSFDGSTDITGNPVLSNNGIIFFKNASGIERSALTYNPKNILAIGFGTSYSDGSKTELWGNGIDFNSQSSQDLGRIDPSGNLSMNGGVSAKGIVDLANNTPAASGAEWEKLQGSIGTNAKAAIIAGLSSDGDNGSHLTYHKFGNIVTLNGYVSFNDDTSTTAETYSTDGAISSGFRPAANVEQYLSFRDSTSTQECYAFISIKTDGSISVRIYGSNNSQVSRYNPKIYLSGLTYYSAS